MNSNTTKYTVLFVDDEPRVTSALKAIFRREYNVLIANSGMEALDVLEQQKVHVIVSDQRMPQILGNELLAIVSKRHPQTMRILLTGFMDKQAIVDLINEGEVYRFINKPWDNQEMRDVVANAALASNIPVDSIAHTSEASTQESTSETDPIESKSMDPNSIDAEIASLDKALLMMEKQQEVRHQIRKFCSDESIMIYGTQNVSQAVAAATTRESIGVAVIELSDDSTTAIQTINLLKRARPELITIALTDEYDAQTAVDLINQGQIFKYLAKPLDTALFQNVIQNAFTRHLFLKKNKGANQRYTVEKPSEKIISGLQNLFGRFLISSE